MEPEIERSSWIRWASASPSHFRQESVAQQADREHVGCQHLLGVRAQLKTHVRKSYLDRLLLHVGDVDVAGPHHAHIVHEDADLEVQRLHLLDSLGHAVDVGEVGH